MTILHKESANDKSHSPGPPLPREQPNPKVEILYISVMCFVANCLSSVALEVGTRLPLGQTSGVKSAAFLHSMFRRSYSLKIKVLVTNIMSGLISTILVAIGEKYSVPYLYIPWLVNTIRGMALCEGPALLGLAYMLVPGAGVPAGSFLFITLLLYVEELCLWNDVFASFQQCWIEYNYRRHRAIAKARTNAKAEEVAKAAEFFARKLDETTCKSRSSISENFSPMKSGTASTASIVSGLLKNKANPRNHTGRSCFTNVTG